MTQIKLAIASDHAGYEYKNFLKEKLLSDGYSVHDYGTNSSDSVDYPDYVHPLCIALKKKI